MSVEQNNPTETSPLLGEQRNGNASKPVTTGAIPHAGVVQRGDEGSASQIDAAREAQFEGVPEARKQLKFIVPAISIGVCNILLLLFSPRFKNAVDLTVL